MRVKSVKGNTIIFFYETIARFDKLTIGSKKLE